MENTVQGWSTWTFFGKCLQKEIDLCKAFDTMKQYQHLVETQTEIPCYLFTFYPVNEKKMFIIMHWAKASVLSFYDQIMEIFKVNARTLHFFSSLFFASLLTIHGGLRKPPRNRNSGPTRTDAGTPTVECYSKALVRSGTFHWKPIWNT